MNRILLLLGAAAAMAACSDATAPAPPAAQRQAPSGPRYDMSCRSGYVIAYDQNGNPVCSGSSDLTASTAKRK